MKKSINIFIVNGQLKPYFYCVYGRGGRFDSGTERIESLSLKKAARYASNMLNIFNRSNAWQGNSTLYY